MRILIGVAVTGEMLPGCDHAVLLQSMDQCGTHVAHQARIFAERADADYRIRGVVVDVEYRRESDVHAKRAALSRSNAALLVGEGRVPGCAQAHLWRKDRRSAEVDVVREEVTAALAHSGAVLVVGADHERQRAQALHCVQLFGGLKRRANRHDEAADVLLGDQIGKTSPAGAGYGSETAEELRPNELSGAVAG